MSQDLREEALAHFGVKGMRWGVHNKGNDGGSAGTTRADKKWGKKAAKFSTFTKSYNAAAQRMNDVEISRINNKPAYKKADFTHDSPLRRKYYKEFNDTFERVINEEAVRVMGTNPSGTKKLQYHATPQGQIQFRFEDVKHADDDALFIARTDNLGMIIGIDISDDTMTQSDDLYDEALAHFGIKGMKWGVRRSSQTAADKAKRDTPHQDYTARAQTNDRISFGNGGVNRINQSLHDGKTHKEAVDIEKKRQRKIASVTAGAVMAAYLLSTIGPVLMKEVSIKAATNRDKRAQATEDFIRNGPQKPKTKTAKKNFRGVYNVTTM